MFTTLEEIESLVSQFETASLPEAQWTHEAHLVVGLYQLIRFGREESIIRLRSRIISMNNVHGTPNSATRGYHETITLFWVWVLQSYITKNNFEHNIQQYHRFLESPYRSPGLLFRFYSREVLFSVKARAEWVEPDLAVLDFERIA
jgi:hypothetical protein